MGQCDLAGVAYDGDVDNSNNAGIERICRLEEELSCAPANSRRHQLLARAIRLEADLYRKTLDAEQAAQQFDPKP